MSIVPKTPPEGLSFGGYTTPTGLQGVGFWLRLAARIIDNIVHLGVAAVCGIFVGVGAAIYAGVSGQPFEPLLQRIGATTLSTYVFSLLGALGYQTLCEGIGGSSVGKRLLGFAVIKEDGSHCTIGSAFIRSLSYFLDSLALGVVAYLAMQRSPLQQRHGDSWAHTVVIYRKKLAPEQRRGIGRFLLGLSSGLLLDAVMITASVVLKLF
jgi:uncharacterized RDD family membrane protein YckC